MRVLAILVVAALAMCACAFQFEVGAGRQQCFYENVVQGRPVSAIFQVVSGGSLDINVHVTAPDGSEIYRGEKETDGRLAFPALRGGAYSFCFGNEMSSVTSKSVHFELTTTLGVEDEDDANENNGPVVPVDAATKEHILPLHNAVRDLASAIQAVFSEHRYLKLREIAHRNTNESTNSRVQWWGIAEIVLLVGAALWQVFYLRRIFEQKRIV